MKIKLNGENVEKNWKIMFWLLFGEEGKSLYRKKKCYKQPDRYYSLWASDPHGFKTRRSS